MAIDPVTPTTLYFGTNVGVYKSLDAGATWNSLHTAIAWRQVRALAVDPLAPTTLYGAGTPCPCCAETFKSLDGGATWFDTGFGDAHAFAIDPVTPGTLFAAVWGAHGVFKSTDGGITWTSLVAGLPAHWRANAVAIDPKTPSTVYAGGISDTWDGSSNEIFKTMDGGVTWFRASGGLPADGTAQALAINPLAPSTVYAAISRTVYRSVDGGSTWTEFNEGLPDLDVTSLVIDRTGKNLHLGTSAGVFDYTIVSTLSVGIDIRPGEDPNSINPRSKGVIAVAIMSDPGFDATTVDPSTVRFGPAGAAVFHGSGEIVDVNADGRPDVVLRFRTEDTGIRCGDTSAALTGKTFGGQDIAGSDSIQTVGCH